MPPLTNTHCTPTAIGILYPGEMGSRIGSILADHGHRLVTTLADRSTRTDRHAAEAGIEPLATLTDVVDCADLVISIVPPSAAEDTAERFLEAVGRTAKRPLYVDANAISPNTAERIGAACGAAAVRFVDASIHGLAHRLPAHGRLYLSGEHANEVVAILPPNLDVEILGDQPGSASAMKMLLGGLSKGIVALFTELIQLADRLGMQDQLLAEYGGEYPGVMEVLDRLLPTYPRHAGRRAEEMLELQNTILAAGLRPHLVTGVLERIREMAGAATTPMLPALRLDQGAHGSPVFGEGTLQ